LRDISKTLELRYAQDFEGEGVKKLPEERNNSRKDAKTQRVAKQTKEFLFALLCVFASLREIVLFFTASEPWDKQKKSSNAADSVSWCWQYGGWRNYG